MSELNDEGKAMALNYIDLLKGSEKYQAAPIRILQPVRILNLYDMPVSAGTGQFLDNDSYEEIEVGLCEKSISNIELEKNPTRLETVLRLPAYFKVHVDDIFHLEEEHTTRKCDDNTP